MHYLTAISTTSRLGPSISLMRQRIEDLFPIHIRENFVYFHALPDYHFHHLQARPVDLLDEAEDGGSISHTYKGKFCFASIHYLTAISTTSRLGRRSP